MESSAGWVMTGVEPRVQGKYGSTDLNQEVNMAPTSNQEKGLKKGKYRLTGGGGGGLIQAEERGGENLGK